MSFIKSWIRKDIQDMKAYHVPEARELTKLDAMESPFIPNKDFEVEFIENITKVNINRYPDPLAKALARSIRNLMDIDNSLDILFGNGSDELIQLLALACDEGDTILSFSPSFVMYETIAKFAKLKYVDSPLQDFDINLKETLTLIENHKPKIIFIAYPNNPTGNLFDRNKIISIIESTKALVVIDEAYFAFSNDSFLGDLKSFKNLVILRTISKISFAGVRLGLLIGEPETINQFQKLRLPYNINSLTQVTCEFLLKKKNYILDSAKYIVSERERVFRALSKIDSLKVYPSDANFLLIKSREAKELNNFLLYNGILVKSFNETDSLKNFLELQLEKKKRTTKC